MSTASKKNRCRQLQGSTSSKRNRAVGCCSSPQKCPLCSCKEVQYPVPVRHILVPGLFGNMARYLGVAVRVMDVFATQFCPPSKAGTHQLFQTKGCQVPAPFFMITAIIIIAIIMTKHMTILTIMMTMLIKMTMKGDHDDDHEDNC